jgi:hypothetical protein
MHADSTDDRRRYPRSRRGVSIILDDAGPGLLNHVDNISGAGVLCHTVRPVPLMTKIGIALELPKPFDHRIDAEGVVVRCEADECGDDHFRVAILFTRLTTEDQDAINHFVHHDLDAPDNEAS